MSDSNLEPDNGEGIPPELAKMFREFFGDDADEALQNLQSSGIDLGEMAKAAGLPNDPAALGHAAEQIRRMLAMSGEQGINWKLAHDLARQVSAEGGDPVVAEADERAVSQALAVAELWLDSVTSFPAGTAHPATWSRADWVEQTMPAWQIIAEPVAASMADALATALSAQLPQGDSPMGEQIVPMMRQLGGTVFCMQLGQSVGMLSREAFGASDVGLPLLESPIPALVARNVDAFAEGLDVPLDEVRLYLAVREAAHTRLFAHIGWLRGHLFGAVEAYARALVIDTDQLDEAVRSVDPTDPKALQAALSGGIFAPQANPNQQAALNRLETTLALVEGWVDEISTAATRDRLPNSDALREMIRRRRAAGGPAEHTLATLVGLELRPRRARDAATLFAGVELARGPEGRDGLWAHPDVMPDATDLDQPGSYLARREAAKLADAEIDLALAELLDAGTPDADASGTDTPGTGEPPNSGSPEDNNPNQVP